MREISNEICASRARYIEEVMAEIRRVGWRRWWDGVIVERRLSGRSRLGGSL